jgi:predicted nucleotidyltransferase
MTKVLRQEELELISGKIAENFHPEKILLFGSYAKDSADKGSDVDLIVVSDDFKMLPFHLRNRMVKKLFQNRKYGLDVFVFSSEEYRKLSSLKGNIVSMALEEGRMLWTK